MSKTLSVGFYLVQDVLFICKFVQRELFEWDTQVGPGPVKLLLWVSLGREFEDISSIEKVELNSSNLANWQET